MNTKAIVDITADYVIWIVRLLIATVIIIFIYAVAAKYLTTNITVNENEFDLATNSIVLCISDKPGTIIPERINEDFLTSCYLNKRIGYKVTLLDQENNVIAQADTRSAQQRLDSEVCSTKPEVLCKEFNTYTLYNNNQGYLNIEVIQRAE